MAIQTFNLTDKILELHDKLNANFEEVVNLISGVGESTAWATISASGGGTVKYRKKNGIVFLVFSNVACSTSSWLTIATLPAGFRPDFDIRTSIAFNGSGTANGEAFVDSDGSVKTYGTNAGAYWHGSMAFPV